MKDVLFEIEDAVVRVVVTAACIITIMCVAAFYVYGIARMLGVQ